LGDSSSDPKVTQRKIEILIDAGRIDEASRVVQSAMAGGKEPEPWLRTLDALVKINNNQLDAGIAILDDVLNKNQRDFEALVYRARAELHRPKPDTDLIVRDLSVVRDVDPENAQIRILLSQTYQMRGDTDAASGEMEAALRASPVDKSIRLGLLQLYSSAQPPHWTDVERLLADTRSMPQFAKDVDFINFDARMWITRKDYLQALQDIRIAMALAPDRQDLIGTFYTALLESHDYNTLLSETEKQLQSHPDSYFAYQVRGAAKARQGDKPGALKEFENAMNAASRTKNNNAVDMTVQAIATELGLDEAITTSEKLAAQDKQWRLTAAIMRARKNDFKAAINWGEQILADPETTNPQIKARAMSLLGEWYLMDNPRQIDKAIVILKKLAEQNPDDVGILNNLAAILYEPGQNYDPAKAMEYAKLSYNLMQSRKMSISVIEDTYGWCLILNGKVDDGIDVITTAVGHDPFPEGYYHLGQAYLKKSLPDDAEKSLNKAQEMMLQMEHDNKPFDETLKTRVQQALADAQKAKNTQ
jgi:tetratricopeptide (TPR) repeat protein